MSFLFRMLLFAPNCNHSELFQKQPPSLQDLTAAALDWLGCVDVSMNRHASYTMLPLLCPSNELCVATYYQNSLRILCSLLTPKLDHSALQMLSMEDLVRQQQSQLRDNASTILDMRTRLQVS